MGPEPGPFQADVTKHTQSKGDNMNRLIQMTLALFTVSVALNGCVGTPPPQTSNNGPTEAEIDNQISADYAARKPNFKKNKLAWERCFAKKELRRVSGGETIYPYDKEFQEVWRDRFVACNYLKNVAGSCVDYANDIRES